MFAILKNSISKKIFLHSPAPNMHCTTVSVALQHLPKTLYEVSALANHEITLGGCTQKLNGKKQM